MALTRNQGIGIVVIAIAFLYLIGGSQGLSGGLGKVIGTEGDRVSCDGTVTLYFNPLFEFFEVSRVDASCTVIDQCTYGGVLGLFTEQRDINFIVNGRTVDTVDLDFGLVGGVRDFSVQACVPKSTTSGVISVVDEGSQKTTKQVAWG